MSEDELRVIIEKQIRDVAQTHQPIQLGRSEAVRLAKFVTE